MDKLAAIHNELGHMALILLDHESRLEDTRLNTDLLEDARCALYEFQEKLKVEIEKQENNN